MVPLRRVTDFKVMNTDKEAKEIANKREQLAA
jgi:hypothetical protein